MLSGVKRSTPFINKVGLLTVLLALAFAFKISAQGLQRGGVKKDTLQRESSGVIDVVDTLNSNPIDSTKQVAVELSYQQRFQSIQFTKDLNALNYHALDTVLDYFHQFDPANQHQFQRYAIGPLGAPAYNLLPEFTQKLAFNAGMNQFKPYQFNKDSIAVFKVNAPYTYLNWIFGTKAHQSFEALHANRIKNIVQFGLRFRRMGSDGYYQRQKTGHTDFSGFLSYDTPNKRYKNIFTFLNQKYAFQQNGGIEEESVDSIFNKRTVEGLNEAGEFVEVTIPNSQVFRRELVDVQLSQAISREKQWTFAFNQYLNFGQYLKEEVVDTLNTQNTQNTQNTLNEKTDSIQQADSIYIKRFVPQFRLKHRIEFSNQTYSYEDETGDEFSFYPNNLLYEPNYYVDTIQQKTWHHELAFIQTGNGFKKNQIKATPFKSYLGLHFESVRLTQQFKYDSLKINNAWAQAKISGHALENIHFEADFQYALFKNSYQTQGHYLMAKLSYQLPETFETWGVQYLNNQYKSPYLYHTYQSNFYNWNQSFPLAKTQHFEVFYDNKEQKFRAAYQQIRFKNYVVFDTTNTSITKSNVIWDGGTISEIKNITEHTPDILFMPTNGIVHRFSINKTFELGWWRMRNQFHFQTTQNELLFMPKIIYQGSWYYSSNLFKQALQFNAGIDVHYTSNFNLPVYHPVLGQFFAQQEHTFQSYPTIDFFFNFKIRTATFFFKAAYVNQGLFQRGYYAAYNYPQADIAIQGGISWRFFD